MQLLQVFMNTHTDKVFKYMTKYNSCKNIWGQSSVLMQGHVLVLISHKGLKKKKLIALYHLKPIHMLVLVISITGSLWLSSYLHWKKTQPAEKIPELHDGSEESSALCSTENDSPPGATVLHRKDISYLPKKKPPKTDENCWRKINMFVKWIQK